MQNTPAWHSYEAVDIDGSWYNTPFMKKVVEELKRKSLLVQAGLDNFSKAEILALHILRESNHDFLWEPLQPDNEDDDEEDD